MYAMFCTRLDISLLLELLISSKTIQDLSIGKWSKGSSGTFMGAHTLGYAIRMEIHTLHVLVMLISLVIKMNKSPSQATLLTDRGTSGVVRSCIALIMI